MIKLAKKDSTDEEAVSARISQISEAFMSVMFKDLKSDAKDENAKSEALGALVEFYPDIRDAFRTASKQIFAYQKVFSLPNRNYLSDPLSKDGAEMKVKESSLPVPEPKILNEPEGESYNIAQYRKSYFIYWIG